MYERFYGLIAKPFRVTPDARFLFQSRVHARALSYLRYGLQSGEGFVVITGHVGAGKTTLAQALLNNLNSDSVVAGQLVSNRLEPDETLRMVAASFGLGSQNLSKSELLSKLDIFLTARAGENKRVLLIVDEVQNLPVESIEELRILSNFQSGDRTLMQMFFLGQSEFLDTMRSKGMEQFRQRVIAAHHLGPLGDDETSQYILHRLRLAGWQNDPQFTDGAFAAIREYTDGIPRRINALCDRALLHGCLEELHEISEATITAITEQEKSQQEVSEHPVPEPESAPKPVAQVVEESVVSMPGEPVRMVSDTERRLRALEKRVDAMEGHRERLKELMLAIADDEEYRQNKRPFS